LCEATSGNNELVCQGLQSIERERYRDAIEAFERALAIHLFEVPNFQLFPRLALAYSKAGDGKKAQENLEKARALLLVLIGTYRCEETSAGFVFVNRQGGAVDEQFAADIARRMCGAAYDYIYETDSLEEFAHKARLVHAYLEVSKVMGGH